MLNILMNGSTMQISNVNATSTHARQSLTHHTLPRALWLLVVVAGLGFVGGCGSGSDEPESSVVPPPAVENQTPDATNTPPGGLTLPPGEIPASETQTDSSSNSGGFEMPAGDKPGAGTDGKTNGANSNAAKVQYASWSEIQKMATTSGRVTVVDLWSLVCEPCLREYPGLVHLSEIESDSVQCIGVDMDYDGRKSKPPETYDAEVNEFLTKVNAAFPNFICNTPSDDVFAETNLVSLPAVLVYDASGQKVREFVDAGDTKGFTYEKDIIPFVKTLIAEK